MKSVDIKSTNSSINSFDRNARPKKKKCLKISAIIISIVLVLAVVFILVAKYKYNFFKKEIYKVAEIKRDPDTTEYFKETKTMTSKLAYNTGESRESEQIIDSKFVVMIMDRQYLENDDYLNTAGLIILESKIKMEGKEAELNSLNIFDDEVMKEFEENPERANYPMAIFHFYKNGTLKDIKVPVNSTKDEIQNMVDLIKKVAPKLTRNRTEDENNGIKITTKEKEKIKSFKEIELQKVYVDKYTNSSIKGSKITNQIERDIENEKLTEVRQDTNIYFETEKKKDDTYLDLGLENLRFDVSYKIMSYEMKENKNDKDLIRYVINKQFYKDSEELLKLILEKEKEEQNKYIMEEGNNTLEVESQLRHLGLLDGKFDYTWKIFECNVLGVQINATYNVSLSNGKVKNTLIFQAGSIIIPIGNSNGKSYNISNSLASKEYELAKIPLVPLVSISFKIVQDNITYGLLFGNDSLDVNFAGGIHARAGLELGSGFLARIEAGVKGNILSANFTSKFQKNNNGSLNKKYIKISANSGRLEIYAEAFVLWWKVLDIKHQIWSGWSKTWNW